MRCDGGVAGEGRVVDVEHGGYIQTPKSSSGLLWNILCFQLYCRVAAMRPPYEQTDHATLAQ